MYQLSYAETLEDDQAAARRVEAMALDRAVEMLADAAALAPLAPLPGAPPSREGIAALHYTCELWMLFARELAAAENALPDALRAQLISLAISVLRQADAIRLGRSSDYAGLAEICAAVRDGLR